MYLSGHVRSGCLCALVVIVPEVEMNMAGFDRVRLYVDVFDFYVFTLV